MSLIEYEVRDRVALVTLNRPEQRNAQNAALLKELDEAFDRAIADDGVRVIVLKANGKHFSAGHDIAPEVHDIEPWKSMFDDVPNTGMLRMYTWELKHYFGYSRKWRDIPKPTIAAVQGACIAAGLMLAWPCDLIIAADDARFSDPVIKMGIGGVEYHGHTWEFGPRKAKELLFTGGFIDAQEAHRLGMVNRVVPRAQLEDAALALAAEISRMHPHALLMAKRAVNLTLDAQGQHNALQSAYDTHSLGHANAWTICGHVITVGLDEMTAENRAAQGRDKADG
ncbi:enoyl-CoA hydratase [Sphingomonas turrisvirgatae]|uniref:Enoyl-CoA hydratase n=2 Tax=Sphingomonas turrisvirgatae TaxID=1888892 RepID=A0A1E3LXF7_9SPHN|nr:enoyl-CoA hydratase [Sphingomonas turrisvirgatae]